MQCYPHSMRAFVENIVGAGPLSRRRFSYSCIRRCEPELFALKIYAVLEMVRFPHGAPRLAGRESRGKDSASSARSAVRGIHRRAEDGPRGHSEHLQGRVTDFSEGDPVPPKKEDYEPERGARPTSGYIGLQNHDEKSRVHFREVSVAPLE